MLATQKTPSVFIVILNYNGKDKLDACLSSVFQSDYSNLEVVIVDNGSQDSSFEQARKKFPRAHFIKIPENLGFSKGNNMGIRFALEKFADYVMLLNNDATVDKKTISKLVEQVQKLPKAGIVSPIIFKENDEEIWFAGGKIDWTKMKTEHVYIAKSQEPYKTEFVSGCAMFVSKEVFQKIGLLDERFFLYYEDTDFSVRAGRNGFDLYVIPCAKINHLEQSNTENISKTYWLVLSALLFFKINSSFLQKIWFFFYVLARKVKNIFDVSFKKSRISKEVRRAYKDFGRMSI